MKNQINLFNHLPRELSTDAFLMWLFHFINRDEQLQPAKQNFFDRLVLEPEDRGKTVSDIRVRRKEKGWERRSDIVLDFKLDGQDKTVLLETRISTMVTLRGYRGVYPSLYTCIYLKTGRIAHQERMLAEKHGYLVRDTESLLAALDPLAAYSSIIRHYCQYLEPTYNELIMSKRASRMEFNSDDFYRLRSRYMRFAKLM